MVHSRMRPNLKPSSAEMQAILYGSAKMRRNRISPRPAAYDFSDLDLNLGLEDLNITEHEREEPQKRIFNAWIEEWEVKILGEKKQENQARLLDKYQLMRFVDDEDGLNYEVSPENLEFKGKRNDRQWCVIGQKIGWKEGDSTEGFISRGINKELMVLIANAEQDPALHLDVVEAETSDTESDVEDADDNVMDSDSSKRQLV